MNRQAIRRLSIYTFAIFCAIVIQMVNGLGHNLPIIPYPKHIKVDSQHLHGLTSFVFKSEDLNGFDYAKKALLSTSFASISDQNANVSFHHDHTFEAGSYTIDCNKKGVKISYGNTISKHYALVTLAQIALQNPVCPYAFFINDVPGYNYRGMHLDVARHFFSVDDIKKYIDYLAFYKFNTFHWHLTDDQGWRIEIKKYPLLQSISSQRAGTLIGHYNDGPHQFNSQTYGGYYTQDQIKEVVRYAEERFVTIIPEIEMPGHAKAALAAYPHLRCNGQKTEVAKLWGIFDEVFCPSEATFSFLEDVLDEVMLLFPGQYIHIGGDECPKKEWKESDFCQRLIDSLALKDEAQLQSYFIKRIEKYVNAKGKKIIGWDENMEGGVAPNATIMSWRGVKGGIDAARMQHDVVMTPGSHCYFDHYQSEDANEPVAIGGYTNMAKVYHWDVIPSNLEKKFHAFVIGGQANVWTEYIPTFEHVEYMAYARGMALAEVLWKTNRNYNEYLDRFLIHHNYWKGKGVNVANHTKEVFPKTKKVGNGISIYFENPSIDSIEIVLPNHTWEKVHSKDEFRVSQSGQYQLRNVNNINEKSYKIMDFNIHKGTEGRLQLHHLPSDKYFGNGQDGLINGLYGSDQKYGGNEWLGFNGTDCKGILTFSDPTNINKVVLRFFHAPGQWIYMPKEVEIIITDERGKDTTIVQSTLKELNKKVYTLTLPASVKDAKTISFTIKNYGKIPEGRQGAGHGAWLFVDEITIE